MGKVKDGATTSKAPKPSKGGTWGGSRRRVAQFLGNLVSTDVYKPMQGWYARVYTAAALGLIVVLGIYRVYGNLEEASQTAKLGIPVALLAVAGWLLYRMVQYPPFVEFLIATEAEMNKVSWTSRADLYRATTVVLVTVTLMSVFLFGVDWLWSFLLQSLGVLKFGGGGAFGSNAG